MTHHLQIIEKSYKHDLIKFKVTKDTMAKFTRNINTFILIANEYSNKQHLANVENINAEIVSP